MCCEVDVLFVSNLAVAWYMLRRQKWTVSSHTFAGIDLELAFRNIMLSSAFESFSLAPRVVVACIIRANSTCRWMRLSDMLKQWPAQQSWFCITIASILIALVRRTSHQIQSIFLRQRLWNVSRVFI